MRLCYSPMSPYVRKVTVVAIETGLADRVERFPASPRNDDPDLLENNPLGKIPAVLTDDGVRLYDSPVICEYLDGLHDGAKLFPPAGEARWTALRRQALADGILDAAVLRRYESLRPEGLTWDTWDERHRRKVERALDALEEEAEAGTFADPAGDVTIGEITIGCALGYLDFRFPGDDWRRNRPALASWYEDFAQRRSMKETVPHE